MTRVLDLDEAVGVVATCQTCGWQASMRGPAGEVATFLRARAIEHIQHAHPGTLPPDFDGVPVRDLGIS